MCLCVCVCVCVQLSEDLSHQDSQQTNTQPTSTTNPLYMHTKDDGHASAQSAAQAQTSPQTSIDTGTGAVAELGLPPQGMPSRVVEPMTGALHGASVHGASLHGASLHGSRPAPQGLTGGVNEPAAGALDRASVHGVSLHGASGHGASPPPPLVPDTSLAIETVDGYKTVDVSGLVTALRSPALSTLPPGVSALADPMVSILSQGAMGSTTSRTQQLEPTQSPMHAIAAMQQDSVAVTQVHADFSHTSAANGGTTKISAELTSPANGSGQCAFPTTQPSNASSALVQVTMQHSKPLGKLSRFSPRHQARLQRARARRFETRAALRRAVQSVGSVVRPQSSHHMDHRPSGISEGGGMGMRERVCEVQERVKRMFWFGRPRLVLWVSVAPKLLSC